MDVGNANECINKTVSIEIKDWRRATFHLSLQDEDD
jgi:hypothetical protein